jgi:hypothetical protein
MTIVALYARVSTKDKGQSTENQLPELRRFVQANGYTVYKEYVEHEPGGTGKHSEFQALFADAHQRRFDLVLFWSLDRFSREVALPTRCGYRGPAFAGRGNSSRAARLTDGRDYALARAPTSGSAARLYRRTVCGPT